jgi:hypothetical protein
MYPKDSVQNYFKTWWIKDSQKKLTRGRLIQAYVPHVDQIPNELRVIGRSEATVHDKAKIEILPLRINYSRMASNLPVAALPEYPNEARAVYRSKMRPLLIISEGGPAVTPELLRGKPKWMSSPTLLAAPYYGAKHTDKRSGFPQLFVDRIRSCEYPQYFWDILPLEGGEESILRLDHIQPVGKHHESILISEYCLSEDGLSILDESLGWLMTSELTKDGLLDQVRAELLIPNL